MTREQAHRIARALASLLEAESVRADVEAAVGSEIDRWRKGHALITDELGDAIYDAFATPPPSPFGGS